MSVHAQIISAFGTPTHPGALSFEAKRQVDHEPGAYWPLGWVFGVRQV
jgi:hypothetical protein